MICASADLRDGEDGVRFTVRRGGREVPAFAIRYGGTVYAYLNRCAHVAVELDWEPTSAVSVPLQFSGTAVQGIDYTISPNPVTFAAGDRSQTVTITVNDDAAAEGTEKATISLGTPTGALLGTPTNFNLTIADTDNGYAAGDKWDLRNPLPTNEKITGVSFIGTNYVAVGTKGTLLSSADGIAWLRTVNVSSNALRAVASSGAIAVAVGDGGQILTSTDGTQWTIRSASGNKDLKSVYWNGAVFKETSFGMSMCTGPGRFVVAMYAASAPMSSNSRISGAPPDRSCNAWSRL